MTRPEPLPPGLIAELERKLGATITGPIAYEGHPDCTSLYCRRFAGLDQPGCVGWHCARCDQPSSQYGHSDCTPTVTPNRSTP